MGLPCEDVAVKPILISAIALLMSTGLASAAEPIVGNWETTLGDTAAIEPCGSGFCITLKSGKHVGEKRLVALVEQIDALQYRLSAESRHSVLLVLQGLDASGKDGVVRRVFEGVNPTGVTVTSFKAPVGGELLHDYLWRIHALLPRRGTIGVFNRSHYEDVVAVRMRELAPEDVWRRRYEHIRSFERMLVEEGTTILKVFLKVSRDEQRARLQERLDDSE